MKYSLLRKKKAPEEGLVSVVANSLNNNSKAINKTVTGVKAITSTMPTIVQTTLADPAKYIGVELSYYIDYILVSFVTALTTVYFFKTSPSA